MGKDTCPPNTPLSCQCQASLKGVPRPSFLLPLVEPVLKRGGSQTSPRKRYPIPQRDLGLCKPYARLAPGVRRKRSGSPSLAQALPLLPPGPRRGRAPTAPPPSEKWRRMRSAPRAWRRGARLVSLSDRAHPYPVRPDSSSPPGFPALSRRAAGKSGAQGPRAGAQAEKSGCACRGALTGAAGGRPAPRVQHLAPTRTGPGQHPASRTGFLSAPGGIPTRRPLPVPRAPPAPPHPARTLAPPGPPLARPPHRPAPPLPTPPAQSAPAPPQSRDPIPARSIVEQPESAPRRSAPAVSAVSAASRAGMGRPG